MDLSFFSPINEMGYGQVCKNLLINLAKENRVAFFPIGPISCEPEYHSIVKDCLNNSKTYNYDAPCLSVWHQHDLYKRVGRGRFIGFPFFELDRFTPEEIHSLNGCDSIFTASQWSKEILCKYVTPPVHVVRLGVDRSIFYQDNNIQLDDKCIFCNISKWEIRKGHDILPTAFKKAFTNKNYELWMMCDNPFLNKQQTEQWQNYYRQMLGDRVKFLPRVQTQQELANIIRHVDCGVFPFKAEAWLLELLEFMSCGKPVIATNYSGPTEYLTSENALLLHPTKMETAMDSIWFHGQGEWAYIDDCIDELVGHLRAVYKNKGINRAGIETANKFSWEKTASTITRILNET